MKKISILIIDDHILLAEAWSVILNKDARLDVVGICTTAEHGIELIMQHTPDMVLMDISLPGMDGVQATEMITEKHKGIKVLGVSSHNAPHYAYKMMRKGASGYVSKFATHEELVKAIIAVQSGGKYICDSIKNALADDIINGDETTEHTKSLTKRELQIIQFIKKGVSSKEMADILFLSVKTIEVHRYNILKKLGLKNSAALINFTHTSMAFN